MARFTCQFDQLDDETQQYLRQVRERKGRGTPGIYFAGSTVRPFFAFVLGPCIAIGAVILGMNSTKDAWAVAMLQTAGVLLGGWLFFFAIRRWFLTGSSYGGLFTYFDATHVYQVAGESVTVTNLDDCNDVNVVHARNDGNYTGSRVVFELGGGRMSVPVSGEDKADEVGDYYDRVAQLEDNEDEAWRNLPPTRIGAAAKFWAEEESPPRMEDAQADVEAPAEPQRAKSAGALPWRYLVIVGAGAICFLLFSQVDKPLRDEAAWAGATATGAGAGGLRGYLLDERNTRHRDEAKARLGTLYDAAIAKVEAMTQDPDARKGLVELLKALKDAPQPIASLSVVEDAAPAELKDGTAGREQANRIELADALATTLGKDLIGFAAPPEGETANVEVKYAFVPLQANAFAARAYTVKWSIAIRPKVGAEPVPSKEIVGKVGYSNQAFGASLNSALKIEVCQALFNQAPPFILPPPLPDDGD